VPHSQALRVVSAQKQQRERRETTTRRTVKIKSKENHSTVHNRKEAFYLNM
jgi:hypothetical protein